MGFDLLSPVADAARWDELVSRLPVELRDVHFRLDLALAHAHRDMNTYLAAYTWSDYFAIQPIVFRTVIVGPSLAAVWPASGAESGLYAVDVCSPPGYGGPVTNHGPVLFAWLRHELNKLFTERGVVSEFCLINPMLFEHQNRILCGHVTQAKPVVVMDLSEAGTGAGYRRRRLTGIETARKAGVVVTVGSAQEFVSLYRQAMDRKGVTGRWNLSNEYLEALCRVGTLFAARMPDGTIESMALVLGGAGDRAAYYHLAANAGLFPRVGANDLLVHEIATWARFMLGAQRLHLGGGVTSASDDSVLFFKAGFSDVRAPAAYYFRILDSRTYGALCERKRAIEVEETGAELVSGFLPLYRREA